MDERQKAKLNKQEKKAVKSEKKYFRKQDKLPIRKKAKLRIEKEDERNYKDVLGGVRLEPPHCGSAKLKIQFEDEIKAPKESLQVLRKPKMLVKHGAVNAGKAGLSSVLHGGEQEQTTEEKSIEKAVETGAATAKNIAVAPFRLGRKVQRWKFKGYEKAKNKAVKHNAKFRFEKAALETPQKNTNPVSRMLQKRRFAKQYRKSLKERSLKAGKSLLQKATSGVNAVLRNGKKAALIAIGIFLLFAFMGSCMGAVGSASTGVVKGIFGTTYMADDTEITNADWYWSQLEADLQTELDNVEQTYTGYDEYRYSINGVIGHNPFELISYLSVMYEDFNFTDIQNDILSLFNEVYSLTYTPETETRYRTVINEDGEEEQESYEYYILNVRLDVADWQTVIQPHLATKDGQRQYDEYIGSGGNHQMFGTPFDFNWRSSITSYYGGREHPLGTGYHQHTGLDIAAPLGTPIYSVMDGRVTHSGWHDSYGNYIDVTDSEGNKSRYAHCSRLLFTMGAEVEKGQAIAEVGSTGDSTGNHLHIEIFLGGERVNPLFLLS